MNKRLLLKFRYYLPIILAFLLISAGTNIYAVNEDETVAEIHARLKANPGAITLREELAKYYFAQSGLSQYFQDLALLWTEPLKHRNYFMTRFGRVSEESVKMLRDELIKILQLDPRNVTGLVLAGQYHDYQNQKEIALWYYQQAVKINPDNVEACLPLADYYLKSWQPDQTLNILEKIENPSVSLRKGAAYLQLGIYPLASGYLQQAEGLMPGYQQVQNKDLLKAWLNVGEISRARKLLEKEITINELGKVLINEYKGWLYWLDNKPISALAQWENGRNSFRDYPFWEFYSYWLQLGEIGSLTSMPSQLPDPEFKSVLKLIEGQNYRKQGNFKEASRSFQESIKSERKLLLNYYELGRLQIEGKKYQAAIRWFTQGLGINPKFTPLLVKRAEAYEKAGLYIPAAGNREVSHKLSGELGQEKPYGVVLQHNWLGQAFLSWRGDIRNLSGFWLSKNGNDWRFCPWSGQAVRVDKSMKELWLLPVGIGLTGDFFKIKIGDNLQKKPETPFVEGDRVTFSLPVNSRLVIENISGQVINPAFISNENSQQHQVPLTFFKKGLQQIKLWFQEPNGNWISSQQELNIAKELFLQREYNLTCESKFVNQREIKLHLSSNFKLPTNARISLRENESGSEWLPLRPVIDYRLSPGDGRKRIFARIMDDDGQLSEVQIELILDTRPPQVTNLHLVKRMLKRELIWEIDEPATCQLRTFHDDGKWQLQKMVAGENRRYSVNISNDTVFCQLILVDPAGNVTLVTDPQINQQLRELNDLKVDVSVFHSNPQMQFVNVDVESTEFSNLQWALSNDLQQWSAWYSDDQQVRWRFNPGPVQPLIYIKIRQPDHDKLKYWVIPVL